ncbi:MAG: oligosaccharide flippase family protein [Flavisolibacter sp.]
MRSSPFFKGLSFLLVLNVLVKPVWIFFIDRQIQNQVGHEAYGKYFAVLSLSYILIFLADAGFTNMMNQRLANYESIHVRQYLKYKLLLSGFYLFACCFVAWITNLQQWEILFYVICIQLLTSFFLFLRNIITAQQLFTADAWFSIIDKVLLILLCAGFIYYPIAFGDISIVLFLKIQLFCTAFAALAAFLFLVKRRLLTSGSKEKTLAVVKAVAPFSAIILLMSMHYRMDGFLLERIHINGAYETGVYAMGYRLLDATNMVGYLAASFLVPFIARHQQQKAVIENAIANVRHVLIFFGIGVASFSLMFAPWLEQLLYHSNDEYHAKVIQLCVAALPAYLLVHIYGSVLTAIAKFNSFIFILVASVIINLVLNLIFIPSMGALGCCVAALVSQYFCALCCYAMATKKLQLPFITRSSILYLLTATGLSVFFYFARMSTLNVWFILGIAICITAVLLITQVSFVTKLFLQL